MSDDLVIRGGGSTSVETESLAERMQILRETEGRLRDVARRLRALEQHGEASSSGARRARDNVDDAAALVTDARRGTATLETALRAASEMYGITERTVDGLTKELAARFGYLFGAALPFIAIAVLPELFALGLGTAIGWALTPEPTRKRVRAALPGWLQANSAGLTDPLTVRAVRLMVMSLDDVGAGMLHLPPAISRLWGDEGLGVVGPATSAGVIVAVGGGLGALRESPVAIVRQGVPEKTTVPDSFQERFDRVPEYSSQIRIDRLSEAGAPDRFEVYVAGTKNFGPISGADPFDMTSNIGGIAGHVSGSETAVRQAMAAAGIDSSSPVVFTGYSQGGLVAADLAASGDFDTRGLFTIGAPAAQVEVPANVPWLAMEHSDDIVPALGGSWRDAQPVVVQRELFASGPVPTDVPFPAHQREGYHETAGLIDSSTESRVTGIRYGLDSFGAGTTTVESTLYEARRL